MGLPDTEALVRTKKTHPRTHPRPRPRPPAPAPAPMFVLFSVLLYLYIFCVCVALVASLSLTHTLSHTHHLSPPLSLLSLSSLPPSSPLSPFEYVALCETGVRFEDHVLKYWSSFSSHGTSAAPELHAGTIWLTNYRLLFVPENVIQQMKSEGLSRLRGWSLADDRKGAEPDRGVSRVGSLSADKHSGLPGLSAPPKLSKAQSERIAASRLMAEMESSAGTSLSLYIYIHIFVYMPSTNSL